MLAVVVNVAQADAAARGRELVTRGDLQAEIAALGSPAWRLITAGIVTPEPRSITFDKEPRVEKKKDQKKGIFCLEGHWWGVKGKTTVEPVLRLLETLTGYNVPYRHYDVGTHEEFDFYLKKWRGTTFNDFPILYLSFHGAPGELHVGEGRDKSLSLDDLAERLDGGCRGRVVHLGSCGTVDVHGRELKKFLGRTGALAVCGFRKDVDWLESAAFDMLVLGRLQGASFLRTSSMRKFDQELKQSAPDLYRRLGFRMSYLN